MTRSVAVVSPDPSLSAIEVQARQLLVDVVALGENAALHDVRAAVQVVRDKLKDWRLAGAYAQPDAQQQMML